MTGPDAADARREREAKLSRRDWILLPLIGIATIVLLLGGSEVAARRIYVETKPNFMANCMILNNPATGPHGVPNSTCRQKGFESQAVEYNFDSCGHRASLKCGPKPPGTFRIVLIGASGAFGMYVAQDKSFAAILPAQLSLRTGRPVEVYNASIMEFGHLRAFSLQMNEVLAAQPDLILLAISPRDIKDAAVVGPDESVGRSQATTLAGKLKGMLSANSLVGGVEAHLRMRSVVQHFIYASDIQYLKSSLMEDSATGFMRTEPSQLWRDRLQESSVYIAEIENKAKAAGVPLAAVFIPSRPQAAMLAMHDWPPGYDPCRINEELRTIVTSNGGTYIDILPDYRAAPDPEQGFFRVDGHPNEEGHAAIAEFLTRGLTNGSIAALRVDGQPAPSGKGR